MNKNTYLLKFPTAVIKNHRDLLKQLLQFTKTQVAKKKMKANGYEKGLPFVDIKDLIPSLDAEIKSFTFLDSTSRVIDIAIIQSIVKTFQKPDYLEIGSWRGESILNIAPYCQSCISVSLSKEEMVQLGFSERAAKLDGLLLENIPNLKRVLHNSATFDFNSLNQKFDVIFVDGDHSYEGVLNDTRKVFPLLKDENSVIFWHDAGFSYEDQRWEVLAGIMDGTPVDKRKHIYRISNSMLAIYTSKKLNSAYLESPQTPTKFFNVRICYQN